MRAGELLDEDMNMVMAQHVVGRAHVQITMRVDRRRAFAKQQVVNTLHVAYVRHQA